MRKSFWNHKTPDGHVLSKRRRRCRGSGSRNGATYNPCMCPEHVKIRENQEKNKQERERLDPTISRLRMHRTRPVRDASIYCCEKHARKSNDLAFIKTKVIIEEFNSVQDKLEKLPYTPLDNSKIRIKLMDELAEISARAVKVFSSEARDCVTEEQVRRVTNHDNIYWIEKLVNEHDKK